MTSTYAELAVVWTDADGNPMANRDATYDFGQAFVGERVPKKLVIRNSGSGPLTLVSLERVEVDALSSDVTIGTNEAPNAAFEVRFAPEQTVGALDEAQLDMFFTPKVEKAGSYQVKLILRTAGAPEEASTATITLKGKSGASECALPSQLDFGPVPLGERFSLVHTFTNATAIPTQAFVGDITGQDAASFGLAPSSPRGLVDLPAGGSAGVSFEFGPTELRSYQATVRMRAGGQCPEALVVLKGQGVDEVLTWNPTALDFGYVHPTAKATRTVTFVNRGVQPITLTQLGASMPSDFGAEGSGQLTIPPGGVPTPLAVYCAPTGLGPRSAQLSFHTGLAKQPQGIIALSCFGGGPSLTAMPSPTLPFGKVGYFANANPAPSVTRRLTVMNTGTKPPNGDPNGNLKLGSVSASGPGQLPYVSLIPANGTTAPGEFSVGLPPGYNPAVGLEAVAGKNLMDLSVTLTPQSVGPKEADLVIYSNDPAKPEVKIRLTGDAQVLPPCNYAVTPGVLNFGLVTPPAFKELPVTITNLSAAAGDVCYLSGIDIAPGSDPAYSLVGGPIASKELQPRESLSLVVKVWPQGTTPTAVTTLLGFLQFNISSPTQPQNLVKLSTSVGPACLTIAPDNLDFGTVKRGCNSSTRTFTMYNTCAQNVTLTGVTMQAAGGQLPGGPDCPGPQACPEFSLVSTPAIPGGGLTLTPGSTPLTFQARYRPIDFNADSGAVAIAAIQGGQNVTYLVSLQGQGDTDGIQTDVFVQDAQPKADVLLTIDNSCSMSDKQNALANNFASFISWANSAGVDYHLAVTTTDNESLPFPFPGAGGDQGRIRGDGSNPKVLTGSTPDVENKFKAKVKVGTNGSAEEQGLAPSLQAVTPPLITNENAGFLRHDANLAIVVVTDAADLSPEPVSYYYNRLMNVKGFNQANKFTFNVIGPFATSAPAGCTYDGSSPDDGRYAYMVSQTSGVKDEICTPNWSTKLQDLGKTAFGFRTTFFLNSVPDLTGGKTLTVKFDGATVPAADYTYDAAANAIVFSPLKTPGPGQQLSVTYTVACL